MIKKFIVERLQKIGVDWPDTSVKSGKDLYVGLFNIGENEHDVAVDFTALGLKGQVLVRDLWKKSDVGTFKKMYAVKINKHGSALLRLSIK